MRMPFLPTELHRDFQRYFRQLRGGRSRQARWAALSAQIDAAERSDYQWRPTPLRWSDVHQLALVVSPWQLWSRSLGQL